MDLNARNSGVCIKALQMRLQKSIHMLVSEAALDFCVAEHGLRGRASRESSRGFREEAEMVTFVGLRLRE